MKNKITGIILVVFCISAFIFYFLNKQPKTTEEIIPINENVLTQESISNEEPFEADDLEEDVANQVAEENVIEIKPQISIPVVNESISLVETQVEDKKEEVKIKEVAQYNVQDVVKTWRPYVVRVTCIVLDENGNKKSYSDGSGFLSNDPKGALIITNKHVFNPYNNPVTDYYDVYFPESKETVRIEKKDRYTNSKGHDLGALVITDPSSHISNLLRNDSITSRNCTAVKSDSDDSLVIIGYPKGSSKTDVSYEQGKLSGYIGSYFISTAKVTEGYSGGIAVSLKDNCFLGITSAAYKEDLTKSLILDVNQF